MYKFCYISMLWRTALVSFHKYAVESCLFKYERAAAVF
jgi:hypothetical protein